MKSYKEADWFISQYLKNHKFLEREREDQLPDATQQLTFATGDEPLDIFVW